MEFTEKLAEFVGLHFGDGSLICRKGTNRLRFQLRGDAINDREHYESYVIPLCNELFNPIIKRNVNTILDKKNHSFGVYAESQYLDDLAEFAGIPIGVKEELYVPDWIKEKRKFSIAFVRGLFDTDGCIYYKKNNSAKTQLPMVGICSICSTSRSLITDSSEILSRTGIKHYIKPSKKNNGEKDFYQIQIYRPHHREFMNVIRSHNPKHLDKFLIGERFGFCPPKTTPEQRKQILKGELNPFYLIKAGVR